MKRFRKSISLILAVLLLASLSSVFATDPQGFDYSCYSGYDDYMCIGDSIAAGYTVSGHYDNFGFVRVAGAYHDIVATGLEANLLQFGCSAFRMVELRYIVEGTYTDKDGLWNQAFARAFELENLDLLKPSYIDAIKKADIVSVNLGSNDILSYSYIRAMIAMYKDNTPEPVKAVQEWIEQNGGDIGKAFLRLLSTAQTLGKLSDVLGEFTKAFNESFTQFKEDFNVCYKAMYEMNPDLQIITVGVYNPGSNISLSENLPIKIGPFLQPFINQINNFLKSGNDYADVAPYADVEGTETWPISVSDPLFTTNFTWASHPTRAGHAYMAAKILEVVPSRFAETPEPTDSAEPTESTEPTQPTTSDEPTTPEQPTQPTTPADPTTPEQPTQPTTPADPTTPEQPTQPTTPADPTTPEQPTQPTTPADPTTPDTPDDKDPSGDQDKSGDKDKSDDKAQPCDGGENCPSKVFVDVDRSADSWYHHPVDWAFTNQVTDGVDDTHFAPDASCTRAQAVTFLWRANNCPEPKTTENPFKDVAADAYYYKAVLWAVENQITDGTSDTTFSPNDTCTRAHIVTFLFREAKGEAGTENPFEDVPAGKWFTDPVLWAVENEITDGTSDTTFSPNDTCTRAHIVTFLYRAVA